MNSTLHEIVEQQWVPAHAELMVGLQECEKAGIPVTVFSSQRARMGADVWGIETEKPRDVDLRVPDSQFWLATKVLETDVEKYQHLTTITGDGRKMRLFAHRAVTTIGAQEVEFMMPLGPVRIGRERYSSTFTPAHVGSLTVFNTDLGPLRVDDGGTLYIYSLRQGPPGKPDVLNAALVLATTTADRYRAYVQRASLPATDRITRFRREVALMARKLMDGEVLPEVNSIDAAERLGL
jgi:hypothetical protein